MQEEMIPFGKYRGQHIEVLAKDKKYLDWLQSQDWFRTQYPAINTLIINNFQQPSETPEHNRLQARFTDDEFCLKVLDRILGEPEYLAEQRIDSGPWFKVTGSHCRRIFEKAEFEVEGVDVALHHKVSYVWEGRRQSSGKLLLRIELKPTLSDDYPAVLRQMSSNQATVLIIEKYDGAGATYEQVKKIFKSSGKDVYLLSEFA